MWIKGRLKGGYEKIKIVESKLFKFDLYLLRMKPGDFIPFHFDKAKKGYNHYRLNLVFNAKRGGEFCCDYPVKSIQIVFPRIQLIFFRPDINKHAVMKVLAGTRYVLSFGVLKKKG